MSLRLYKVALGRDGGSSRQVHVMSETDVQAGDAAAPLMSAGESILSIEEIEDDGTVIVDGPPANSQAAELAPVTPGAAAAPDHENQCRSAGSRPMARVGPGALNPRRRGLPVCGRHAPENVKAALGELPTQQLHVVGTELRPGCGFRLCVHFLSSRAGKNAWDDFGATHSLAIRNATLRLRVAARCRGAVERVRRRPARLQHA
jgi:hypothetical protein